MEHESKTGVKLVVQEFVSGKITDRKLSVDGKNYLHGENYLQWWKIIKIHMKGWSKKCHLIEDPPEPMTESESEMMHNCSLRF